MKIMDPISREEAVQVLANYGEHYILKNTKVGMAFSMAVKALETESQPIIHAKWLPYKYGDEKWHKCSNCDIADQYKTEYKGQLFDSVRNYCPNCGAKMDGGNAE